MSDLVAIRDQARFTGPAAQSKVVERSRLDHSFAAATGKVLRVLAPAGYGKSTLVARWVANDTRSTRWLDLEPIDNDPLVLAHVLTDGLADFEGTDLDRQAAGLGSSDDLWRSIAGIDEPFVLVLDDIHHLTDRASTDPIDVVIENLRPDSTLVLVGRACHHPEAIARHRLQPGVVDVTADALALDLAETEEMLTKLGVSADIESIKRIADQFEGWPAGLRLAAQVLVTPADGGAIPLSRLGDTNDVTDYITGEWFGGLGPEDQNFLTEIGCLERFTGEQCDAVLGRHDSASILHHLCRNELMIIPLDQTGDWYRMHAVLSRWLSSRLQSLDRERWRQIHIAASRWWARQHDVDLAIEHAATAGEMGLLEDLVKVHSANFVARGMHPTVDRWLARVEDARIRSSPELRHAKTVLAIGAGDGERALNWMRISMAEHDLLDDGLADPTDVVGLQTEALFATLETHPAEELIPAALNAHCHLPAGAWRSLATLALGANLYLAGDERAIDVLRESLFESEIANTTAPHAVACACLSIVLDLEGQAAEATELSSRATSSDSAGHGEAATGLSEAVAALVDARAGRLDEATERIAHGRARMAQFDRCAPWFNILGLLTLARASLLVDDVAGAGDLLHQLERKMASQDETTSLAAQVEALHDRVHAAGDVFAARDALLTAAELRVVQYLPTNLSLADIATRLYVSRNTVKSHAASIYRKLGVGSRGEAVEVARQTGLIDKANTII